MRYKGYTQGDTVVLVRPIPVPDGTEVSIVVSKRADNTGKTGRQQVSITEETFGLIPAAPALIRRVLEEDLQEDLEENLDEA